jgi:hypothetical protein
LENRIQSAIKEEQEARELCNYIIDATQTEQEVLQEVL